jgi:hypothetical protein
MRPTVYYLKQHGWVKDKGLWYNAGLMVAGVSLARAKYLEHRRTIGLIESLLFRPASNK